MDGNSKKTNKKPFLKKEPKKEEFMSRTAKDRLEMKKMKNSTENFDKKEAALKIIQTRRQENQEKATEKQKVMVTPTNMPWVPNPHFLLPANSISALSVDDHKRYVAIISNFIRMDKALRFEYNNIELEAMDLKLAPERDMFTTYVKEFFESKRPYSSMFKYKACSFVVEKMKARISTLSKKGYHMKVNEIEWKKDTRSIASRHMYVKKPTVLSLGKPTKLTMPDPTRRCVFDQNSETLAERFSSNSSKSLRDDAKAFDLAIENDVTAILTSSSMRHLLTAPFPLRQYRRAFPLSIFRKFLNGTPQRVVTIGSPLPCSPLTKPDMMRVYAKYVVRNFMEKQEQPKQERMFKGVKSLKRSAPKEASGTPAEVKKSKVDVIVNAEATNVKKDDGENKESQEPVMKDGANEDNVNERVSLTENEKNDKPLENIEEKKDVVESIEPSTCSKAPKTNIDILDLLMGAAEVSNVDHTPAQTSSNMGILDSIFNNMESSSVVKNENSAPATTAPYSYSVIPVDDENTHKVLVRFRPHGKDMVGNAVSVATKVQYIPQCGAEQPYHEEKIWDALTATIKNSVYQSTVHLNVPEGHCVQLCQTKSTKIFETLPEEAKELFSGRWQRLFNLLEEVKELKDGEYLMVENENEMLEIWCDNPDEGESQWSREKIERKSLLYKPEIIYNDPSISFKSRFNGFDYHLPLVWHVVKSRIPASFLPPNPNKNYSSSSSSNFRGNNRDKRGGGFQRGRGRGRGRGYGGHPDGRKLVAYIDHDAIPADEEE